MENYKNDSKMIIVEGTDRSGKTELIKERLKNKQGTHILFGIEARLVGLLMEKSIKGIEN